MIRNLLLNAATSPNQTQRNQSVQILNNEFTLKSGPFIEEIFTLLCSQDRIDHVISYSYFKKLIRESYRGKLIDMNEHMQKAFIYWYEKERNRNSFEEMFIFQRQNIIQLNALYLSLNTSNRYRQSFIDIVPFRICQFFTKGNKHSLYQYLTYYGEVLKQLDKYRIGNINSKKAAMGSIMLLKVTTKLNPQDSVEASLWVNFSINFSKFNSWIPDKNFLIKCLIQHSITKDSLMTLLDYLSTNFKIVWVLQDYCKILQGLQKIMFDCENNITQYKCKQVETILKCLRSFLHSFFTCDKNIQSAGDAMIAQYIYSYEQFEKTSLFLMNMIEYFSYNNEQQSMGNLSQMIVQFSTQILRLYSNYLEESVIEKYAKTFMQNFTNNPHYEKLFIFFSSLPKLVLQIFDYDQGVNQILTGGIPLSQKYEPVYVNFLTHYITVNDYLDLETANKLASFFFNLVKSRAKQIQQFDHLAYHNEVPELISKNIERVSLSIYALSKLSKYKVFVDSNLDYFQTVVDAIFEIMLKSTNDFSILVDSINQLIQQKKIDWNQIICQKALSYLVNILDNSLKNERLIFYQIEIQLYRIVKKTICLLQALTQIQSLWIHANYQSNIQVSSWSDLNALIIVCNLEQKSQAVKEEILFLVEQVLVQFNKISHEGNLKLIEPLLIQFSNKLITNLLFEELYRILQDTAQISPSNIVQNNMFDKVQIGNEEYAIIGSGFSRQLHLTCVKILLELSLYEKYLEMVFMIISKLNSKYLLCVWQAIQTLYPGKIEPTLIPGNVKQRLQKIRTGHLLDLFENLDLNGQKLKMKQTPSWYQLYRDILRSDSIVIEIVHQKFNQNNQS